MQIIVGKTAGFCYGVKRAVDGATDAIKENSKTYCLGELVHNKQVIEELSNQGLEFIEDIKEAENKNAKVIIRAHGIEEKIYKQAKESNIELLDYTCPMVLKIHEIAKEYQENGYYIFLIGAAKHPEIVGIASCCGEHFDIIQDEEELQQAIQNFEKSEIKKLLVIVQTTYNREKFSKIEEQIKNTISSDIELVIRNTICYATEERQKETEELAKKVDFMIIIGGRNSSNTKKLFEIASNNCKNTICIETKEEIDKSQLKGLEKIGIMAGASTPQKSIEEVVEKIK